MYKLTDEVLQAYSSESREISVRATFNNNIVITGENIKSYTITDSVGGTESLSLGNACSKRLEMSILVPPELTSIEAAKVEVEVGIDINGTMNYTPLGVFYVDEVTTNDNYKTVDVTAYDAMYKIDETLGDKYTCKCSNTRISALTVIKDVCNQAGVAFDEKEDWQYYGYDRADVGWVQEVDFETLETQMSCTYTPTNNLVYAEGFGIVITNDTEITEEDLAKLTVKVSVTYYGGTTKEFTPTISLANYDSSGQLIASSTTIATDVIETGISATGSFITEIAIYVDGFGNISGDLARGFYGYCFKMGTTLNLVNEDMLFYGLSGTTVETSARNMIGYMAGVLGCNAIINREGNLTLKPFEQTNIKIPLEQQFMNGVSKTVEADLTIDYITTGAASEDNSSSNVIIIGSGAFGLNFENPYLTPSVSCSVVTAQQAVQNIFDKYQGTTLIACTVSHRGNPAIDCGDIVQIENEDGTYSNVFVLNQTLSVTGGLSADIDCGIKTTKSKDFVAVPSSKKLSYKLDDFVQTYSDIIKAMTGSQGGYVKWVIDDNNKIRAIAITESDIEVKWDSTYNKVVAVNSSDKYARMWVWSYDGLGYTSNGGNDYSVAINMAGKIYANLIVGQLGKYVELQAEKGTIGGWTIEEQDLYKEFTDGSTTYKAYIQGTASSQVSDIGDTWVFSTQTQLSSGSYSGKFYVTAKGDVKCNRIYTHEYDDNHKLLHSLFLSVGGDPGIMSYNNSNCTLYHTGTAYMGQVVADGNLKTYGNLYLSFAASSSLLALYVNTNGIVTTSSSSSRYKENITTNIESQLDPTKLYDLPVKQYNYKSEYKENALVQGTQIGLIAEDVDKFYPNACVYNETGQPESWQDRIMIPAMLKLIQDQKKQIDALEQRVTDLENKQEVI